MVVGTGEPVTAAGHLLLTRLLRQDSRQQEAAEQRHDGTGDDEPGALNMGWTRPTGRLRSYRDDRVDGKVVNREARPCATQHLGGDPLLEGLHVSHGRVPHGVASGVVRGGCGRRMG